MSTPFLSLITVVFNDLPGLRKTLTSVAPHRNSDVEHWIIDGSSNDEIRLALAHDLPAGTLLISEPDDGLYDAMNKGLAHATGRYVLFLNAGDRLDERFALRDVIAAADDKRVLLGYIIEEWQDSSFLHPGLGREHDVLTMPPHPGTFYPKCFYRENRYDLTYRVVADGKYTERAVEACGATFVPVIVSRFELGGRSSTYTMDAIRGRLRDDRSFRSVIKTLTKGILWGLVTPTLFYRILARGKYTPLTSKETPPLLTQPTPLTD